MPASRLSKLCFPACGEGAPAEPAAEPRAEAARAGLTVLLVDDDELIQSSLAQVLEVLGHNAVTARSGEEAIGRLEAGLDCDAVILDMNMPGLGGAGTLPRLRALRPRLPILLSTGRVEPAVLDLVRAHPFVTLLSKPFSMADLQEHLQRVGDHAGGSPDPAYPLP